MFPPINNSGDMCRKHGLYKRLSIFGQMNKDTAAIFLATFSFDQPSFFKLIDYRHDIAFANEQLLTDRVLV